MASMGCTHRTRDFDLLFRDVLELTMKRSYLVNTSATELQASQVTASVVQDVPIE